jgi:hypothetical protein
MKCVPAMLAAAFLACVGGASALPSSTPLRPKPAASSNACAAPSQGSPSLEEAFAHDIADVPTLRFIANLDAASEHRQQELLRAPAAAPAVRERILTEIAAQCETEEVTLRSERALLLVANRWSVSSDDPRYAGLTERITTAVEALAVRHVIDRASLDAALAPFALRLTDLPSTVADAGPPCEKPNVDAATIDKVEFPYPDSAQATGTSGTVEVKVLLDENGLVRSVSLLDANGTGLAIDDLSRMTIFAAAASTYRPAIEDCSPISSYFVFGVEYTIRY